MIRAPSAKWACPSCHADGLAIGGEAWTCSACGATFPCVEGIPRLYVESAVAGQDRRLRDSLYNGLLGRHYGRLMPFLSLPARPFRISWRLWIAYAAIMAAFAAAVADLVRLAVVRRFGPGDAVAGAFLAIAVPFLARHRYLGSLLLLAVPARLATWRSRFRPDATFPEVHGRVLEELRRRGGRIAVLDVSTGTGNSLFRHGWMTLDAAYAAVDLSETMILQAARFMREHGVEVDFALADAANLPFGSESFDAVLNYGAVNGMADPGRPLAEMARVTKPGGWVLFFDEQLYPEASSLERLYFEGVLSRHDVVGRFPAELLPRTLESVEVHQVYAFYYLCVARRTGSQS